MIKRLFGGLAAVIMLLSAASAALAADNVPGSVYGVPRCDNGANSGSKSCLPQDVPDTHFAAKSIVDVVKAGLMTTDDTGSFRYDAKLSNGEAVTVILRLLGLKPEPAKTGNWAAPIISQAADLGLIAANTDPNVPMTRAGMAILIAKALKIEPQKGNNAAKAFTDIQGLDEATQLILAALRDAGIFEGYPDGSFKPDSPLTRAEMAVLIERILAHFQK